MRRLIAASVALVFFGCSESTPAEGNARDAAVVEQVVRSVVATVPVDDEAIPVAYVLGADGTMAIEVQAAVAAALVDEVDVRFADERSQAIDDSTDALAVRDDGVLVVVGTIPAQGRVIDVEAERYLSADDYDRLVLSLRFSDPDWAVTSTSVAPPLID